MMADEKAKVGDMRPVFQQVGFEVCKVSGEKEEFVQTEKQAEAEIMSYIFKLNIKED